MSGTPDTRVVLDTEALDRAIHGAGYGSLRAFADALGLHRNTVGNYLSGHTGLPTALERMLVALDLEPSEILRLQRHSRFVPGVEIRDLVDELHDAMPDAAFVLFGSRARGTAKTWSDFDLGVYRCGVLDFPSYSRLVDRVEEWNEGNLHEAQLVDLVAADVDFVRRIGEDVVFLAGSMRAWCALLRKAGWSVHG